MGRYVGVCGVFCVGWVDREHVIAVTVCYDNANSRTCDRMLEGSSRRKHKPHDGLTRWYRV